MKKTLLFYSLAIVTAATAMAGLRHTQKAPAALDAKLEALTAKPHSPSLREIGSEIVLVSEDFAKFTAGSEDDPDGTDFLTGTTARSTPSTHNSQAGAADSYTKPAAAPILT